jgi:hypothetical protein
VAEEARALARSLSFAPPAISAGLDLMTNFARRQDVARAEQLIDEVAEAAARATAWHGWLWKIRLGQARAELALARRDWDGALQWSDGAIDESRLRRRVKYEVLGLQTRAAVLHAQGRTRKAIGELRRAVASAKSMGDPAIFLRAAMALLALDGDDALADAAASTATRISQALPDPATRRFFEAALPSGLITRVSAAREPEPLRRALGQ